MEKYEFSTQDYLMYKHYFEEQLDKIQINSESKSVNQQYDKTFKEILSNQKEMKSFIKQFIGLEVENNEIERYNSNFITQNYERRESDIIYKIKEKDIYYLIEHQSYVDKNMPKRILEYCMELMREIQKSTRKKDGTNPIIIPIVIYTGIQKWKVATNFSDTQKVEERYKDYTINLKYKLIDINKYSKEELLEKDTKMSSMMLIEKYQTSEEIRNILIELRLLTEEKERINWLKNLAQYVLKDKLGNKSQEIIELIKEKEKSEMEEWLERVKKNDERIRRNLIKKGKDEGKIEGIKEALVEVIKNMLQHNQDEDLIMKFTNAKREDIEKVKQELKIQTN